jgi:cell division control protein 6
MSQREYSLRSKTPQQQKLDYYVRKRKQIQNETETPPKKSNSPKMTLKDKENHIKRLPTPRKRNAGKPVACRQLLLHPLDPPTPVDSTQTTPQIKDESSSPSTPRKQIAPIDKALCALHHTIPDKLISRDKEISEIKSFLKQCTSKCIPASMYICGPPGTGKSVSLMHLLSQEKALLKNVEVIVLNCVSIGSSQSIFGKIAEKLKIKRKPFDKELTSFFTKPSDSMILLVLDEIDQLSQSILYTIFEWPSLPDSRCILIGIIIMLHYCC